MPMIDIDWLKEKLEDPDSLAIAIWNGKPLVEKTKEGGKQKKKSDDWHGLVLLE